MLAQMSIPMNKWFSWILSFLFLALIPAALAYMFVYSMVDVPPLSYGSYEYPDWVQIMGYFVELTPLIIIVLYFVWYIVVAKVKGSSWKERVRSGFEVKNLDTVDADDEDGFETKKI